MKDEKSVGKKGIIDAFIIVVMIFTIALSIIIFYLVIHNLKTPLTVQLDNPTSTEVLINTENTSLNYDYIFPITFVFLAIFIVISAFFIRSHPIFFFVSILLMVILIMIAAILSNTYEEITASSYMNETAAPFEITNFFMGNLPIIAAVIFAIAAMVLFSKPWQGGQQI